jgi:hypothetical protein
MRSASGAPQPKTTMVLCKFKATARKQMGIEGGGKWRSQFWMRLAGQGR